MPEINKFDLLVVGGINRTGFAREAAGRKLSIIVCELGELASENRQ